MEKSNKLQKAALDYHSRGFCVIPVQAGGKRPIGDKWQTQVLTKAEVSSTWKPNGHDIPNIGVNLGTPSGLLVDIDCDMPEASVAARALLPKDYILVYGRLGARRSHYLYRVTDNPATKKFSDPEHGMVVELRGTGAQSVLPPSVHPSGEYYEVDEPFTASESLAYEELLQSVAQVAAASILARRWVQGKRHELSLAVSGALLNSGWTPDAIKGFLVAVCQAAMDSEIEGRLANLHTTVQAHLGGDKPYTGLPKLVELIGDKPVGKLIEWLGLKRPEAKGGVVEREVSRHAYDDFVADLSSGKYIHLPTNGVWASKTVNNLLPKIHPNPEGRGMLPPSVWLDREAGVEQVTWAPGEDTPIVRDKIMAADGTWVERPGARVFNSYRAPRFLEGSPELAQPWVDLVKKLYPEEAGHIIRWFASRVQRPDIKINHCLVLGGGQGVGKDTIVESVVPAIGKHNVSEVSPTHIIGRFNPWVKSVLLRVSEVRDLGDGRSANRFDFYEKMKPLIAAPPAAIMMDEKGLPERQIPNLTGVIFTTNHRTGGIYIHPDDRRHFMAWSDVSRSDFEEGFWPMYYTWLENGGYGHIAAYLRGLDLSDFSPKAPPPATQAFDDFVAINQDETENEFKDAIEGLGCPVLFTARELEPFLTDFAKEVVRDPQKGRLLSHRFEGAGYTKFVDGGSVVRVRFTDVFDASPLGQRKATVYARRDTSLAQRREALKELKERIK